MKDWILLLLPLFAATASASLSHFQDLADQFSSLKFAFAANGDSPFGSSVVPFLRDSPPPSAPFLRDLSSDPREDVDHLSAPVGNGNETPAEPSAESPGIDFFMDSDFEPVEAFAVLDDAGPTVEEDHNESQAPVSTLDELSFENGDSFKEDLEPFENTAFDDRAEVPAKEAVVSLERGLEQEKVEFLTLVTQSSEFGPPIEEDHDDGSGPTPLESQPFLSNLDEVLLQNEEASFEEDNEPFENNALDGAVEAVASLEQGLQEGEEVVLTLVPPPPPSSDLDTSPELIDNKSGPSLVTLVESENASPDGSAIEDVEAIALDFDSKANEDLEALLGTSEEVDPLIASSINEELNLNLDDDDDLIVQDAETENPRRGRVLTLEEEAQQPEVTFVSDSAQEPSSEQPREEEEAPMPAVQASESEVTSVSDSEQESSSEVETPMPTVEEVVETQSSPANVTSNRTIVDQDVVDMLLVAQIVALERDQEAAAARGENRTTFLPLPTPAPEEHVSDDAVVQTRVEQTSATPSVSEVRQIVAQDRNIVDDDFVEEDFVPDQTQQRPSEGDDDENASVFGFLGKFFGQS